MEKKILLASPRGFCIGVARGVKILEDAIADEDGTVFVRKEIVHNTVLVEHFKSRGAVFVDEIDEIPAGSTAVFSTHGVAPEVREAAAARNLKVIDATCPLVKKVHYEAIRYREMGFTILLIGDAAHPEVVGVTAEAPENIRVIRDENDVPDGIDAARVAVLTQTTLNFDDTRKIIERLREKFPLLHEPPDSDICYATRDRQRAVRDIAAACDLFIAVGSANSNNTHKLAEVALEAGARHAIRVDSPAELDETDFSAVATIGITSGVSVTEAQIEAVIARLAENGFPLPDNRQNKPAK